MSRVHWSVWGFVGFFGMMLMGLWVDSRWLLGVGHDPAALLAPITQVREQIGTNGTTMNDRSGDSASPCPDVAEPMEANVITIGLSAPGIFSTGLEIPFDDTSDVVERLPDPEVVEPSGALAEPIDHGNPLGLKRIGLEGGRLTRAQTASAEEPGDPAISDIIEGTSPVMRSAEFGGDAAARAEYLREVQRRIREKLREDEAATPASTTYDKLAAEELPPPRPPMAAPATFPTEFVDAAAGSLKSAAVPATLPGALQTPNHEQVDRLREAALQLDQLANDLERQTLYHRADQVRAVAQELRLDARKGASAPPSPVTSVLTVPPR